MSEENTVKEGKPNSQLALARMKDEIEEIAKKKAKQLIQEAKEQANQIIKEARLESEEIIQTIVNQAKNEASSEKIREISKKKQSIKMDYLDTREAFLEEIFVKARSDLQKYTEQNDYFKLLEELVIISGVSIGGGDLILQLRKEDRSHFSTTSLEKIEATISKTTGLNTTLSISNSDLIALGGIKVARSDQKLYVDNTFESRLERVNEESRVSLLDLFG